MKTTKETTSVAPTPFEIEQALLFLENPEQVSEEGYKDAVSALRSMAQDYREKCREIHALRAQETRTKDTLDQCREFALKVETELAGKKEEASKLMVELLEARGKASQAETEALEFKAAFNALLVENGKPMDNPTKALSALILAFVRYSQHNTPSSPFELVVRLQEALQRLASTNIFESTRGQLAAALDIGTLALQYLTYYDKEVPADDAAPSDTPGAC
jgi:chromosome segregation ATPase